MRTVSGLTDHSDQSFNYTEVETVMDAIPVLLFRGWSTMLLVFLVVVATVVLGTELVRYLIDYYEVSSCLLLPLNRMFNSPQQDRRRRRRLECAYAVRSTDSPLTLPHPERPASGLQRPVTTKKKSYRIGK